MRGGDGWLRAGWNAGPLFLEEFMLRWAFFDGNFRSAAGNAVVAVGLCAWFFTMDFFRGGGCGCSRCRAQ